MAFMMGIFIDAHAAFKNDIDRRMWCMSMASLVGAEKTMTFVSN